MSEPNNAGEKTLTVAPTKTLSLKRPAEQGTVRQSFSHGRTKQVVVEKVKRRVSGPGEAPQREVSAAPVQAPVAPREATVAAAPAPAREPSAREAQVREALREAQLRDAQARDVKIRDDAAREAKRRETEAAKPADAPAPVVAAPIAAAPVAVAPAVAASPAPAVTPAKAEPVAEAPVVTPVVEAPVVTAPVAVARPAAPVVAPRPAASPSQASRPAAAAPSRAPQATTRPQSGQPFRSGSANSAQQARPAVAPAPARPTAGPQARPATPGRPQTGVVLRTLTEEEREARARALIGAKSREEEDRRRAEADAILRAEREVIEKVEREAAEVRKREEDARRAIETEAKRKSEEEAKRRSVTTDASGVRKTLTATGAPRTAEEESAARRLLRPAMPTKVVLPPKPTRGADPRNRGRLTVTSATSEEEDRTRSIAAFRRRTQRLKGFGAEPKEKLSREIVLPETITIQELGNRMSERGVDVVRLLMKQGQMLKITDVIDADTAQLLAEEMGHTVRRVAESDVEDGLFDIPDEDTNLLPRPPVVTIMGHVDHGKTSLLDAIRHKNVVSGEAGGITQHIGAYQVIAPGGKPITFIDTPGHAAFTAMRARGAKVTDIVVLVVAADDGVMPQTAEAIAHAQAAGVPIIVAINKIDKNDAKPERVRAELLQYDVQTETMGGDTLEVEVSATKKINLDKLLEGIELQAELLDLRANPERAAEGTVIEARLDKGRGPVATVLVQRGTLKVGDLIVAGSQSGRVRALIDDQGNTVTSAGPSLPVEVLGFSGAPDAGDRVAVVESEARAREITEYRERQKREKLAARGGSVRGSLADMMSQLKTAGRKEFPLVIKGDVQGSVEAIMATLEKLGTDEVTARVVHAGVGGITESDVTLAEASNAVVLGFNVRAHKEARSLAEQVGIEVRYYNIIYNLVDDVKAAMSGMLAPTLREEMLGNAQILEVFNISKVGKVAGCRVTDGTVQRGAHVRLIRDNVVVHEGKLSTLKRFKDEVKDVVAGQECGMAFESYQDMRQNDVIECYLVHSEKRYL
ncbi:translation initiation factor IF-2 [Lichenihabitans sp. PAMC28606]|uniref:translation initiation factor IF-2 n=1 Tax=Lichenihabitans sp. PAMC28606 TaxID=2880932 RepID=UPI001D0A2060|nr:translation initiation factor IF-2 [Lichenihabitans sp. PAMC28606]UDL94789.1 translation initiation factor IF-2 [Lichenihabitans sp. PAMC28606]